MNRRLLSIGVLALLLTSSLSTSVATATDVDGNVDDAIENAVNDPSTNDAELEYWNASLAKKGEGIFFHDGVMFLVSKKRFDKRHAASLNKALKDADRGTMLLLKKWTQKEAASRGSALIPSSENQKIAWKLLDRIVPGWMTPEWSFSGDIRTIVRDQDFNAGVVTVVTTVNEVCARDCVKRICARCAPADVNAQIVQYFRSRESAAAIEESYKALGIVDLIDGAAVSDEVKKEYSTLENEVARYLKESELAERCRQEANALSSPVVVTNRAETTNPQGTETVVVETIRTVVRTPRMQQLFLSGGKKESVKCVRLDSGRKAETVAFDANRPLDEKLSALHVALCENPGDEGLWNLYGRCLMASGDKIGAVVCFRNALRINKSFEYAIVNLASAYKELMCANLSVGLALLARGTARQKWSIDTSEQLLQQ